MYLPEYITVEDKAGYKTKLYLFLEANDSFEFWICQFENKETFTWQNDMPLLKALKSGKRPKWQLAQGKLNDSRLLANALDEIKQIIKKREGNGPESMIEYMQNKKKGF